MKESRLMVVICSLLLSGTGNQIAAGQESNSTKKEPAPECVVETHNPHAAPEPQALKAEAPEILNLVERIVKAYSAGNLKDYEALLDKDCSYFDYERNSMIQGKAQVIEYLKESFAKHAPAGSQPLLAYTIDQPYIKVLRDRAVVTYRAFEKIGGSKPMDAEGVITKIFVKTDDNGWKQQYDSSSWHAK
jgi:ketosteroid isomerase-like protein